MFEVLYAHTFTHTYIYYNMGHNGHGINLYGVIMTLMKNVHAGGHSIGHLSLVHRECEKTK